MILLAILLIGIAAIAWLDIRASGRGRSSPDGSPGDAAKARAIQYFASGALPPWR